MSPKVHMQLSELDIPLLVVALMVLSLVTENPLVRDVVMTELENIPDAPGREQALTQLSGILTSDPDLTLRQVKELQPRLLNLLGRTP